MESELIIKAIIITTAIYLQACILLKISKQADIIEIQRVLINCYELELENRKKVKNE